MVKAAEFDELHLVKKLIEEHGANVSYRNYKALQVARYHEYFATTEYLLSKSPPDKWKCIDTQCLEKIISRRKKALIPNLVTCYLIIKSAFPQVKIGDHWYCGIPNSIIKKIILLKYWLETLPGTLERQVVRDIYLDDIHFAMSL